MDTTTAIVIAYGLAMATVTFLIDRRHRNTIGVLADEKEELEEVFGVLTKRWRLPVITVFPGTEFEWVWQPLRANEAKWLHALNLVQLVVLNDDGEDEPVVDGAMLDVLLEYKRTVAFDPSELIERVS